MLARNASEVNSSSTSDSSMNVLIFDERWTQTRSLLENLYFLSLDEIEDIRKQFEAAHPCLGSKVLPVKSSHLFMAKKPTEAAHEKRTKTRCA